MAPYAAPPSPPTPALPLAAYAGTYANDYVGTAKVEDTGPGLVLQLGAAGHRYLLKPFNRDLFLYAAQPEAPGWLSAISFAIGPDGKASKVTLDDFNDDDLGTLSRVDRP